MDKTILSQYIDACSLVQETEEDIRKLKRRQQIVVQEVVKGSMPDFPYTAKKFHVSGTDVNIDRLNTEENRLKKRKARAEETKIQVETWLETIPLRMQRIIRHRFFEGMTWGQVAIRMGRKASADSVRLEFERFIKNL